MVYIRYRPHGLHLYQSRKEGAIAMDCDGGTFRNRIKRGVVGYSWGEVLT